MTTIVKRALVAAGMVLAIGGAAQANEGGVSLHKQDWSWKGIFGRYDQPQLQRGFQVFHEVCSTCHGMKRVAYRNLSALGFSEDRIKELAAEKEFPAGPDDNGDMFTRPGTPADHIPSPFANDKAAAAANGGAAPPDLSLLAKARPGGPNYIYSLLEGYASDSPGEPAEWWVKQQQEKGLEVAFNEAKYFNDYFPGHAISMPPPLMDDLITYEDGTAATKDQMAQDVVAYLNWAAEPELDARKSLGLKVLLFLGVLTAMLLALKLAIWRDVKH
ncbi:cytochrome c1 [Rhodospirillum rubrum]|uniref:Cytochrome c1 n=1 Tax=Rhodospirillum rubrum (strain ATCC 11170 / ATH 1.1.1 / DSM 467 / LMG 4362 / NCIMB 8255 / S1) TaxID=269796 RepID=Q2RXH8_RHORT|nr:cytochrome c1 [Rhodospirillum rubrum]ABC21167.1 Cytochrome c1 [Rhodospirillum rubrum ATCC 11170]AEO46839.1 cytochrome c1 [Rhodospirillum rubrum F11]MBK5952716.1 cytochrome c1 [Rhodospirillum rubrum]QXG80857.1 cytochrome c1 [Rhodospirillum rubrum]HAQ01090.1 cytochrome c1 [Rhodospirillum rubrum]